VRIQPDPYPLAPAELRDLVIDVLNWLGWESESIPGSAAMRLTPPDAAPIELTLTGVMNHAVRPPSASSCGSPATPSASPGTAPATTSAGAPPHITSGVPHAVPPAAPLGSSTPAAANAAANAAQIGLECPDRDEAVARILLDEIHGAIQRRTNQCRTDQQGKAT
jgi:hypothetical protein